MIKNVQVSKIIYQRNYSTANQKVALKNSTFYGLINFLVKFQFASNEIAFLVFNQVVPIRTFTLVAKLHCSTRSCLYFIQWS